MRRFQTWLRQPSTLSAIGVLLGAVGAAVTHLVTMGGSGIGVAAALVGALIYALVNAGIDDNTAARAAEALAVDVMLHRPTVADVGTLARALAQVVAAPKEETAPLTPK